MKFLVISDLHLGRTEAKNNDFLMSDKEFSQYLISSLEKYDKIVLNGDILELWQTNFNTAIQQFHYIKADYPLTFALLEKELHTERIIYVNGNHDAVVRTKNLMKCCENYVYTSPDEKIKIRFEHGHRADVFNSRISWFGKLFANTGSLIETYIDEDIDQKYENLVKVIDGHTNPKKRDILEKYAFKLAEKYNYQAVILSHTHHQKTVVKNNVIYANTGCGIYKRSIDELVVTVENNNITVTPQKTKF